MSVTQVSTVEADGVKVFYRHAGEADKPVVLLLHGFPSSSFMFRNLIPLLAQDYRVVAPDLPGFGFTIVPEGHGYAYTFDNFAKTTAAFLDALRIERFAVYIFDYGAPTAFRLALRRPEAVAAIVTQNGNAYVEGLGEDFWPPVQKYWASGGGGQGAPDREALRGALVMAATRRQYEYGSPHPERIQPEAYHLDQALLERPGNKEIQLDLFYDYRTNVELYPAFHEYFRSSGVPVLAVWGKNDFIFVAAGADAFERDVEVFEKHFLDAGHFALETNEVEVAGLIGAFLRKHNVFG